ncbi:S1 family peptidase [Luteococcus sp. Sow4_B9]|uniref:S1 family peptidase n=1 Tax=Luteococcus sp. Sow4_B9 TaxID=3438792 RepID=UPI003F9990B4
MRRTLITVALAATTAAGTLAATPTPANAILGGTQDSTPWVVKVFVDRADGSFSCTGSAISDEWIVTAEHCTREGATTGTGHKVSVSYGYNRTTGGTRVQADAYYNYGKGDVALVHLAQKKPLWSYGKVVDRPFTPSVGQQGRVYGYGTVGYRYNDIRQPIWGDGLKSARVDLLADWPRIDEYYAPGFMVRGIDGSAQPGDSGGPLVVNGQIVGIASKLDSFPTRVATSTRATGVYSDLSLARGWVRETSGI